MARPPSVYTFMHGDMQVSLLSDGVISIGDGSKVLPNMGAAEVAARLKDNFLPTDNIRLNLNVMLVNTGGRLVLIDCGLGAMKMFGEGTGQLAAGLKALGIGAADIDAVVISHAHADHMAGLIDEAGRPYFANATVHISQSDFDFWTDEGKLGGPLKAFVEAGRACLLPQRDRLVPIEDGKEVLPGIVAMAAPGHTVGHTVLVLSSDGKVLVNVADLVHHPVLFLEKPRTEFVYDTDSKQAVASRLRVLDMLATDRLAFLAYHFPWPGIGHVARAGEGYRYHPSAQDVGPL